MRIRRIYSGGPYEDRVGYCRAVVAGNWVHVSGTVGQGETVEAQCADALNTIEKALKEAGASYTDVVRVKYILPNSADFEKCWPRLREAFGKNPPAATMIECGLIDPKFHIEIEVTAFLPE